jgi:hypothetical protein
MRTVVLSLSQISFTLSSAVIVGAHGVVVSILIDQKFTTAEGFQAVSVTDMVPLVHEVLLV